MLAYIIDIYYLLYRLASSYPPLYLAGKTLAWLRDAVYKDFSDNKKEAIEKWVAKSIR